MAEEEGMPRQANVAAADVEELEATASLAELWAALEQGWTVVQDVAEVDSELRNKVGTELIEEVDEDLVVSYISRARSADYSEETVKDVVQVDLQEEKLVREELRSDAVSGWVQGAPYYLASKDLPGASSILRLFTLKLQPWYKKELRGGAGRGHQYVVKLEVQDIMWNGNMARNESDERGFFVDQVEIRLTPAWESAGEDRNPAMPLHFFPPPPTGSTDFQRSTQTTVSAMAGQRTTAGVARSRTRSQTSTSLSWITEWERSADSGSAILRLKLNVWGLNNSRIFYNFASPEQGNWGPLGHVPQLPGGYQSGNFTGLSTEQPSAGWTVQASTFHEKKVRWKLDMSVRASTVKSTGMKNIFTRRVMPFKRKCRHRDVEFTSDQLISLTPNGSPASWMFDQLNEWVGSSYISLIVILLVPALLSAAVSAWLLLHGR